MTTEIPPAPRPRGGQILIGLAIMLVGLGFLMHRLDMWHVHLSGRFWPLILLVIGAAKFLDGPVPARDGRSRRGGMWLIYVGIWGLVSEFGLFGLSYDTSWPLLVIALGLNVVWRAVEESRAPAAGAK